jgi:predicted TIM-barrel fold metal-dependent hydrolase
MSEDRYVECAQRGAPLEGFVMDIHMHLGEQLGFHILHYRDLGLFVREMDRHGVDVGGVASIPGAIGGHQPGGNAMVLEALRRFPERFFGWTTVNPFYPNTMRQELERCYHAGLRGVKLHDAVGLPYDHENYRIVLDFAAERGMPVLLHTFGTQLDQLERCLREYPTVNCSLAHAGCAEPETYVRMARTYPHVYLDICYSKSPRGLIEYFVQQGVTHKVMFSSDCYFMDRAQQLGRVVFAKIAPEHKATILGENARRFLGDLCPC